MPDAHHFSNLAEKPFFSLCAALNRLHFGAGKHLHALFLAPILDHAACGWPHHARHHAITHFHHRKLHAALLERFHDDAADEACAHLNHLGSRLGQASNRARIGQSPATVNAGAVDAGNWRGHGRGAGGDQKFVKTERAAVAQLDAALGRIEHLRPNAALDSDAQFFEMTFAMAQMRALLADFSHQQIGNRHARIRRFVFVANDRDLILGGVLANGFRRNHASGTCAEDDVVHKFSFGELKFKYEIRIQIQERERRESYAKTAKENPKGLFRAFRVVFASFAQRKLKRLQSQQRSFAAHR